MLSSVNTLATHPPLSVKSLSGRKLKEFAVDDYHVLTRFNKSGGGWGYNVGSVEAVLFCPDHDVLLGGFGLYGGRGQYNAEVKVYESSESGDVKPTDDNLVVSTEEKGYSCERNKTFKSLFEHPVVLVANNWYLAHIKITSPSGASTDAGSSGQAQVTGPDSVVFNFKNSRESNNGTDVGSGQIPEFLYRIPEFEQETDTSLQLLDKEFAVSVSPVIHYYYYAVMCCSKVLLK
jgi:E3 ubiquitin-protein ligase MYCBP2